MEPLDPIPLEPEPGESQRAERGSTSDPIAPAPGTPAPGAPAVHALAPEMDVTIVAPGASASPPASGAPSRAGSSPDASISTIIGDPAARSTGGAAVRRPATDPIIGRQIGGVTITSLIGEGGMGRVYMGTLGDGGLRVAVKLLSRGFDNPEAVARFQREAQILDTLRHPGIAEMKSHGVWDDGSGGIPYMVMELIEDARTLEDFAAERKLDLRGRLELFLRACEAVGFAHRMKILHRDLKPANLLVDRFGRVKVIDFGVARAANGDLGIAGVRTQTGQLIGTVQYMSPEQIAGDPRAIDLRTDVYALGVILYEMLLASYPYDVRGLPLHEAARIVSESRIEPPRARDPSIDEALEGIVMKCLARRPDDRYDSAVAVAKALERYLFPPPIASTARAHAPSRHGADDEDPGQDDAVAAARPAAVPRAGRTATLRTRGAGGNSSRRGWPVIACLILLVAAGGAVATGKIDLRELRRLIPAAGGGSSGAPAATIAAPATLNMENLTVLSAPEGALVTIDGQRQGRTPLSVMITWSAGSGTKTVEVSAPGYETSAGLIVPDPAGRRAESLRMVFNLTPRGAADEPVLERLLPLRVEGGGVEVRIDGGPIHALQPGLREVKIGFTRAGGHFASRSIVFRAPGRRIEAFGRSAVDELRIDLTPELVGDHATLVRVLAP